MVLGGDVALDLEEYGIGRRGGRTSSCATLLPPPDEQVGEVDVGGVVGGEDSLLLVSGVLPGWK